MLQFDNTLWFKGNIKANPTSVCTSFSVHVFMNDFNLLHKAEVGADLNEWRKHPHFTCPDAPLNDVCVFASFLFQPYCMHIFFYWIPL